MASPEVEPTPTPAPTPSEQLLELVWMPNNKSKKEGKGRVTVTNNFQTPLAVAMVDYNGSRMLSQHTVPVGQSHDITRTQFAGIRYSFPGSDGHCVKIRAWPADWTSGDFYEEWELLLCRDNGRVSIALSRSWEAALGNRRFESERLGVSASYLTTVFEDEAIRATGDPDPTFHTIAPQFACGEQGLGRELQCPRDGRPGCSIVDALPDAFRGRATHFLSWAWGYTLTTFVNALREWLRQTELDPAATFLWICFFCNNQFRILEEKSQEGSDDLEKAFAGRLTEIGKVVVLFDTWKSPFYLQRVWCVFEAFMADNVGAELQIILPFSEAHLLEEEIRAGGLNNVIQAFRSVNIEKARATREVDEARVKELIVRTSSFERVNQVVKDRLVTWCKDRFSLMVEGEVAEGGPREISQGGLAAEVAGLRSALAQRDTLIAELQNKSEQLKSCAARERAELAALRGAVASLHGELWQRAGSDLPEAAFLRALCERLEVLSEPRPHSDTASSVCANFGEELESLMDSIVSEVCPSAKAS